MKPYLENDIVYFVNTFIKIVEKHLVCEYNKQSSRYIQPFRNSLVIDKDISKRIGRTVYRYREANLIPKKKSYSIRFAETVYVYTGPNSQYQYLVRLENRTASIFTFIPVQAEYRTIYSIFFFEKYYKFEFTTIVKTLLLYGEMDIFFKLTTYDSERLVRNRKIVFINC